MISQDTESLLCYRFLKGVGKKALLDIAARAEATSTSVEESFNTSKNSRSYSLDEMKYAKEKTEYQIQTALKLGHRIISRFDEEYPASLRELPEAPPILFCAGNIALLKKDIITVIGTREPTEHGITIANRITEWLTDSDWVIASGLAKGVDTIAHQACLDHSGKTISVFAHGLEKVYPAQNKQLASDILENDGLLISEYGYNSYTGRSNFVERDKVQAAIAKAVVLVQSDLVGGSLHASRAIIEYQRFLVAVGQSPKDINNKESKIEANMLLLYGNTEEKANLLKTQKSNLKYLLEMPDRTFLSRIDEIVRAVKFKDRNSDANSGQLF